LKALFDLLKIDKLHCAQGALRHGVLFDLIERDDLTQDTRELTVKRLQKTFAVDLNQSARVTDVSQFLMSQISTQTLDKDHLIKLKKKLQWAAQLHEIGSVISHSDYHKHGAYILDQSDAPGFSVSELHRLSLLVLGHRGKLRKLDVDFDDQDFCHQLICLRLAVILCHARRTPEFEKIHLLIDPDDQKCFILEVSASWKTSFPQSAHLLNEEVQAWLKTSWHLKLQDPLH
jgi:exopolyphosphatase/guanosine-5'-triphosphate,3'-diphosphate pyrophosphatase